MNKDNRANFYCVYLKTKNSIVLESADKEYLRMTGLKKCGMNICDIYGDEYSLFVSEIFSSLLPGETMRFIRNDPSDLRYVTVLRDREYLRCVGVPIWDAYVQLKAQTDKNYACIGIIEAEKQNGIFVITDLSSRISFYFSEMKRNAPLEKALQSHSCPKNTFYMPDIVDEEPVELCVPLKRSKGGHTWYCKINIAPIISDISQKLIITVSRAISDEIYGASFCELNSEDENIRISKMDNDFAALISEGNINPEDIFQNIRIRSSSKNDPAAKLRDVKNGGDRTFYGLQTIGGSFTGTVISTPKPLPNCKLTTREFEVLTLAAKGNTIRYIAYLLGIKEGTVKKTMHNGFVKLGISSKAELTDIYRSCNDSLNKYRQIQH